MKPAVIWGSVLSDCNARMYVKVIAVKKLLLIAVSSLLFPACSSNLAAVPLDAPLSAEKSWEDTVEMHVREDSIIMDNFVVFLSANGLLETMALRNAVTIEKAKQRGLSTAEANSELEAERQKHRQSLAFILAIDSEDFRLNRFENEDSEWVIRLINAEEKESLKPASIANLGMPNEIMMHLYPFLRPHDTVYEVIFDRKQFEASPLSKTGEIRLRIGGNIGHCDLVWKLSEGGR